MPQVPNYSPVPDVSPTLQGLPSVHVDTPAAAFGGTIGQGLEQSGNELFNRAIALQQLNNETEARAADSDYMVQAGQLHANYNALQGKDRVDAFPKYQTDLTSLRDKIRGSLTNAMAQKMYDASSLSTLSRSIFNGAGAAAAANKDWQKGTVVGQLDVDARSVEDNPNDEGLFQQKLARVDQSAAQLTGMEGFEADNPKTIDTANKLKSHLALRRVVGMARNQPYQASQLLTQYKEQHLLYGDDVQTAEGKVQGFIHTTGMSTLATTILGKYRQPDGNFSKSFTDMEQEAKDTATKTYPDDAAVGTAAAQALEHNYNQLNWAKTQDDRAVQQELDKHIAAGATSTDLLPPDLVSRMTPKQIKGYPAAANAYQRSEQVQTDENQYRSLLGLYNNDNGKFMDTNIYQVPGISKGNMNFFLKLQREATPNGDPRVSRAMTQLKGYQPQILDDLNITGKTKDPATANQFVGALHEAIQSYQETNGKPPDEKTLTKEIFPTITRQITQPGWLWNSQPPFFSAPVPEKYTQDYLKINPAASEPEIRRDYSRQMFDQFFKSQKASKDQSRIGQ